MKTLKLILFLVALSGSSFAQLSSRPISLSITKAELIAVKSVRQFSTSLPKDAKIMSFIMTGMKDGKVISLVGKDDQLSTQMLELLKKVGQGSKIFTDIKYSVNENSAFKNKNLTLSLRVTG